MPEVQRWRVTYTQQIKQKRKVYHDGFLDFNSLTFKATLHDESGKLLVAKVLRKEEVVESGEALTFASYLVDVLDVEGDQQPDPPNITLNGKDDKITKISKSLRGQSSMGKTKFSGSTTEKSKTVTNSSSPSQKIIKEFKNRELQKYGTSWNPETTKSSITGVQWQVLYTTQITQKAKKHHDGFLQLVICGSRGRQVLLYDERRNLLEKRFLNKGEVICYGQSLKFDGHLVDIGEFEVSNETLQHLNLKERNPKLVGQPKHLQGDKDAVRKWHALYMMQITQKAKKYHHGVIRLASCGSHNMQVILLHENGTTLSSRFLKRSEDVRDGSSIELPKYLVEVGDPWTTLEGNPRDNISQDQSVHPILGSSAAGRVRLNQDVPANNPLRNVQAILSILKHPIVPEGIGSTREEFMEQCHASKSANTVICNLHHQVERQLVHDIEHAERNNLQINAVIDEEALTIQSKEYTSPHFPICEGLETSDAVMLNPNVGCIRSGAPLQYDDRCKNPTESPDIVSPKRRANNTGGEQATDSHGIAERKNWEKLKRATSEMVDLPSFDLGF